MPVLTTSPSVVSQYESNFGINQSGLKDIMYNGIQSFIVNKEILGKTEKYFEDKEHFLIGKAVDIFMSFGKEVFNSVYHTSSLEDKPSDTMMKVLHMALNALNDEKEIYPLDYHGYGPLIHSCLNTVETKGEKGEIKIGYYMNRANPVWSADTRLTNDVLGKKSCIEYWKDIVLARGKQVLSREEKLVIDTTTNNWLTHPHTASLFEENPDIIRIHQYPVYFIVNGVWCKGLIDKVDIDLVNKTITIYDFKTMRGFTLMFPRIIKGRRYDLQLSFYYEGLRQNLKTLSDFIGVDLIDFDIMNPVCIVESTNCPGMPMQFELSDSLLFLGQRGDDKLFGYEDALEEYQYWYAQEFNIEAACHRATTPGKIVVDSQFKLIKP